MNTTTGNTKFALIGVGGFVAPHHLRAIKEVGSAVMTAIDPAESVGVIDIYFPETRFFVEFERFEKPLVLNPWYINILSKVCEAIGSIEDGHAA
jgi:hypothetical protein